MSYFITLLIGLLSLMPHTAFSSETKNNDKALVVILLGAPGSGKGTQAIQLSKTLHIPHISTGDLFRYNIKNNTPLGQKVKSYMDAGNLVPDSLVLDMLFDRLKQDDCKNGFLLDGSPRTVAQAESIDSYLKTIAHRTIAINLQVSDAEVVRRITGRRTCSQCGKIYHIETTPPKVKDVCDVCQGALVQRSDDNETAVKTRLEAYHAQTKPVEVYYEKQGVLVNIDGSQSPDSVFEKMCGLVRP